MLELVIETINRLRYKLPSCPQQAQIEVTNRCNMTCPMCPRESLPIELEHMEWNTFIAVMDKLDRREDITLTGWGEPFLHPRIFDMIAYCKERGHKVMITSNGLFPKPALAEEIVKSGLDALTFSIDSLDGHVEEGHASRKVFENIETVVRLRRGGTPALRLQATLHADCEADIYDIIRYAAKTGVDVVNVGRIDRKYAPGLRRPCQEEEERIFREADRIATTAGIQLDWLQYAVSGNPITRTLYGLLRGKLHRSGRYCLKTYDYIYVNRLGDVTPCCLLPDTKMGNLLTGGAREIWQSRRFGEFRENYRAVCGSCDLWTVDMLDGQTPPTHKIGVP